MGSYNYIGFACHDDNCTPLVIESLEKFGASTCASRINGGESYCRASHLNRIIAEYMVMEEEEEEITVNRMCAGY